MSTMSVAFVTLLAFQKLLGISGQEVPDFNVAQTCSASCHDSGDCCMVSGDPHFCTWNGVKHHFQGGAFSGYYYIDGNDIDNDDFGSNGLPFDLIGYHHTCNGGARTCVGSLVFRLWRASDNLAYFVTLRAWNTATQMAQIEAIVEEDPAGVPIPHPTINSGNPTFTSDLGESVGYFVVEHYVDGNDDNKEKIRLKARFYDIALVGTSYDDDSCGDCGNYDLIVQLYHLRNEAGKAEIWLSSEFDGANGNAHGLCGLNDGIIDDDIEVRVEGFAGRRLLQQDRFLDPSNMQTMSAALASVGSADDGWAKTRLFGDSWAVDPDVGESALPPLPSLECINTARSYCTSLWHDETNTDCQQCEAFDRFNLGFEGWLEDCIFDACSAANGDGVNLEVISLNQALIAGYFDMPVGECEGSCITRPGDCSDWTSWMDRDNPSATGDWERIIDFELDGGSICDGGRPSGIECRSVNGGVDYADYEFDENIETRYCVADTGFLCVNGDGSCPDFEVRFCCGEYVRDTSPYFECPDICTDLTSQNGCAGDQCLETCRNCITGIDWWDYQGGQNQNCQCHNNGCNLCPIGWFKVDYDFPCQPCSAMEGCSHCTDFSGCQQCQQGYTMVQDDDCGEESHFNTNNQKINYCVPI